MKKRNVFINSILMNLDMIIILLYFVFRYLIFTSDGGLENLILFIWLAKIMEVSVFMVLYIVSYLLKLVKLYKFFIVAFFVYNIICFIVILVLSANDLDVIITYLLPLVCSISQLFRYKKIKNNA